MWHIKSHALRERRLEKIWSIGHLAKVAGVSARTLGALEKSDRVVSLTTLGCVAKALGIEARQIARQGDASDEPKKRESSASPAPAPAPSIAPTRDADDPRFRAYGPDVTELPKLTRLETLVAMELSLPARPPLVTADGEVRRLTAKLYQDIFTAYLAHEGAVAYLSGRLESQRGMSREQAKICGTKCGAGARFHFVYEVQPGHEVGMTVHTSDLALTRQLQQRLLGKEVGAIVKVVVAPEEVAAGGGGYEFFMSSTKTMRPWGLEVVAVVDAGAGAGVRGDAGADADADARARARAKGNGKREGEGKKKGNGGR